MLLSRTGATCGSMRGLAPSSAHKPIGSGVDASSFENRLPQPGSAAAAAAPSSSHQSDGEDGEHDDAEVEPDAAPHATLSGTHASGSFRRGEFSAIPSDVFVGGAELSMLSLHSEIWLNRTTVTVVSIEVVVSIIQNLIAACEQLQLPDIATALGKFLNHASALASTKPVDRLLQELRSPLASAFSKELEFVFEILFQMLELGPQAYKQPLLKILSSLLLVTTDVAALNNCLQKKKDKWLTTLARCARSSLASDAMEVINVILARSPLTFRHAETNSLRSLPHSTPAVSVFSNTSSIGMKTVVGQLEHLLGKNALIEPGIKSEMLAPPRLRWRTG